MAKEWRSIWGEIDARIPEATAVEEIICQNRTLVIAFALPVTGLLILWWPQLAKPALQ